MYRNFEFEFGTWISNQNFKFRMLISSFETNSELKLRIFSIFNALDVFKYSCSDYIHVVVHTGFFQFITRKIESTIFVYSIFVVEKNGKMNSRLCSEFEKEPLESISISHHLVRLRQRGGLCYTSFQLYSWRLILWCAENKLRRDPDDNPRVTRNILD